MMQIIIDRRKWRLVYVVCFILAKVACHPHHRGSNVDIDKLPKKFQGRPVDMSHDARMMDPVHGIRMGIKNPECDDGVTNIGVDWDGRSTDKITCYDDDILNLDEGFIDIDEQKAGKSIHICLDREIKYNTSLPLSGPHRPLWPMFGEYLYLPPQRWVHSLEHGTIALLYHPCMVETAELAMLKSILTGCLRKHVITPYRNIPNNMPFALLAFKHARLISRFEGTVDDFEMAIDFIKEYALKAPESHVLEDGQYSVGLLHEAEIVSDLKDSEVCPITLPSTSSSVYYTV